MREQIQRLENIVGLASSYIDVCNKTQEISLKSRLSALMAMGYSIDDDKALENQIKDKELKPFVELLDRVTVLRDDDYKFIYINTPETTSDSATITYTLTFEDGTLKKETRSLYEIEIASYKTLYGVTYDTRRFIIDYDLPYGYHSFECVIDDNGVIYKSCKMSLIVTPLMCYMPDNMQKGDKYWGVSVQLYSLRSKHNWGIGDFSDLKDLVFNVGKCGGNFVGLNPLHAGYPANPDPDMVSPYSPSSRQWLNIIYISVEDIYEFKLCKKAKDFVNSKDFKDKILDLKESLYVKYTEVLALKLKVLRMIFDDVFIKDKTSQRYKKFKSFCKEHGSFLENMATYDALQKSYYDKGVNAWGWMLFDKALQDINSKDLALWKKKHTNDILFYSFLQFIADEQLDEAFRASKESHMELGLYRDLAVGVSKGSCDVWADKDNIYKDASVGAPPDPLGPIGQSWGLSPMDPYSLKMTGYRSLIKLYQQNMKSCGAMRIDHAAGLYRLWWVPLDEKPLNGAYVNYPMHDLLGIIALESQRNKCLIIAEDLGTIPQTLRDELKKVGALSYKLFFGEIAFDGGFIAPKDYQSVAMSALTTHDMPTLVGWWEKQDLILGQKLGLYTKDQALNLGLDRDRQKQRILDSLHGLGSCLDDVPFKAQDIPYMTEPLCKALQYHMCKGSCLLFSSQLEDWIFVKNPVNIPGTFREYPNWRRKLTMDIDDIFKKEFVTKLTDAMSAGRLQ